MTSGLLKYFRFFCLSVSILTAGCRKEMPIIPSTGTPVTEAIPNPGPIKGFFLLNEGNMGSNKASIDYFDYTTGIYTKNIFEERNPGVVKELGDVGNDLQIYGERLYAVINCSHFVEVMDVNTAKHIGVVSIPNCRYIVFKDRYAYVSSYAGPVQIDPNARLGYVAKVDTATLEVVGTCVVGYQPEEMVVVGDKLYVANSGGYRVPNYDNTVSVIDLNTFTETGKIEAGINLHRMELDPQGYIWVSSRGDYKEIPSKLYLIDPQTDRVVRTFDDLPCSNMALHGEMLYLYSTQWSWITSQNTVAYSVVNTATRSVVSDRFIQDGTDASISIPYGLAVHPDNGEIFVTDAKNYVTPGTLYCFTADGHKKWSVTTGDIPAHFAFTTKKLQPIK